MNDFDDLDDLFGQLRSGATDAELAAETSHVDAMVRHHRRQKGHTMFSSRRARVAAFVAAGVIGFGGIAAASPGGPFDLTGSDDTTTTSTSEVTTTTSEAPTTTSEAPTTTSEAPTTTSEAVDDDDAAITRSMIEETVAADDATLDGEPITDSDDPCFGIPGDFDNHGEFVSSVARGDVTLPPGFGQRDAAQSSCGKDDDDDADEVEADQDHDSDDHDSDDHHSDDHDRDDHDRDDHDSDDHDSDDHDSDDHDSDDDGDHDDDRVEQRDRPGKPESAGKQGHGSKKHSDD